MSRLTEVEHAVVGNVDQKPHRSLTDSVQTSLHNQRRNGNIGRFKPDASVARAVFQVVNFNREFREAVVLRQVHLGQRFKRTPKDGRELARESVMPPQVRTVRQGLVVNFDQRIGFRNVVNQSRAVGNALRDFQNAFVPFRHAQFFGGTANALRRIPGNGRFFNHAAVDCRSDGGEGDFHA